MQIKKDIPVTVLQSYLFKKDPELADSLASLVYLPNIDDPILNEKAVASIALSNNIRGFCYDMHGFANTCLIMNGIPAVQEYVANVHPEKQNYAIWELRQKHQDLKINPDVVNYIISSLESFDFLIPPRHLQFCEYHFLEKYKEAERLDYFYDNYKINPSVLEELEKEDDFYKFHFLKLIEVDRYQEKMEEVYNTYIEALANE